MPRDPIQLREYERLHDLDLTEADARALSALRAIEVTPSAGSQELEIRIKPKVSTGNLLFLLHPHGGCRSRMHVTKLDGETSSPRWTAHVISSARLPMGFVHHAEIALRQGVLQSYVRREDALHTVRGRIRTADQLTRRFGLPLPLEVTFDEFTPDIAENQILRTALQRVSTIPRVPPTTVRAARHLVGRLEGVSLLPARTDIPTIPFTRLNERYRSAVVLGRLILNAESLSFRRGVISTTGFLFDMNKVFEDFVTAALTSILGSLGVRLEPQHTIHLDNLGSIPMRPDVTWYRSRSTLGVADIKYKSLATAELPNADVYQVLAYAIGHRLRAAHLIYAAGNEASATHEVRNLETTIRVHALDLSSGPTDLLSEVAELATELLLVPHAGEAANPGQ
jgi:5-methylcytosine-specific restriction enzyme subunit McrC